MEWTKISVRHGEYLLSDASDSVFRTYVRIMLLTSVMELKPNSEQCAFHLGRKNYNNLTAYLQKKDISLTLILDKVMEDVAKVQKERKRGKYRKNPLELPPELPKADKIREDKGDKIKKKEKKEITHPPFVSLSEQELKVFYAGYGKTITDKYINTINDYLSSTGKKPYKDYAATIRNWMRRDNVMPIARPNIVLSEKPQKRMTEEEAAENRKKIEEWKKTDPVWIKLMGRK